MHTHHFLLISNQDALARAIVPTVLKTDCLSFAATPFAASGLLRRGTLDAILIALEADDEDAAVFCRTVRHFSAAPIVLLVNSAPRDQVRRAYRLGADAHIELPCDPRLFRARLDALLRRMTKPPKTLQTSENLRDGIHRKIS